MNYPDCTYKSQYFSQSKRNFAPSHNSETVTFTNSGEKLLLGSNSSSLSAHTAQQCCTKLAIQQNNPIHQFHTPQKLILTKNTPAYHV